MSRGCCGNCLWSKDPPLQANAVATRQYGRPKVVLQKKVTKLKREIRHFDETLNSIQSAMINFLNEEPTKTQQFQINGGLLSLKSSVNDVLEAMKGVSLKDDEEDDEEGDQEDDTEEDEAEDEEQ
ncbi:hypothetical protein PENNAL_c0001G06418 [Penicillium nalgiovense]|uniref:Uncharacterized protein n=1 Tax=Penicillium nalgiovense TaxID=60175 RepID=A0A1V6ZAF3_PENNA|nr:hypothetical protein PENNAL_c0001G06418 [Penicillium nalgiovense]